MIINYWCQWLVSSRGGERSDLHVAIRDFISSCAKYTDDKFSSTSALFIFILKREETKQIIETRDISALLIFVTYFLILVIQLISIIFKRDIALYTRIYISVKFLRWGFCCYILLSVITKCKSACKRRCSEEILLEKKKERRNAVFFNSVRELWDGNICTRSRHLENCTPFLYSIAQATVTAA